MTIEIETNTNLPCIGCIDIRAETLYPNNVNGFFGDGRIHFVDGTIQLLIDDVVDMVAKHNTLNIFATSLTIEADGIDEIVITCPELPINMDYAIYRDNVVSSQGGITDGSIELSMNEVGKVMVEIRNPANYQTGYIEIEGI